MLVGKRLMSILYKGYKVPKVPGRYVDMGMSFKKNEEKRQNKLAADKGKEA